MKKSLKCLAICAFFILSIINVSMGADFPNKPITLINPMAPGGTLDLQARAFASVAEKFLGQPMVVINKTGAAGMIGGLAGAQATPDGYTLTVGSSNKSCTIEWETANGRKPSFTRHDFIPLGSFTLSPTLVIVPYNSPWKTLEDLIKDCKTKPGHYAFSSGGLYQGSHIPVELLLKATGLKCRHVPYTGGGPALTALVGGHVDFACQYPATSIPLVQGKKIRVLAVQSNRRLSAIADIPTVKELGIDAEWYLWVGILAPKRTAADIVKKLRETADKVVKEPSFITAIENTGDELRYMNGDELAKFWDGESEKLAKLYEQMPKESSK